MEIEQSSNNRYMKVFKPFVAKKDKSNQFVQEIKQKLKISSNNVNSNFVNYVVEGLTQ